MPEFWELPRPLLLIARQQSVESLTLSGALPQQGNQLRRRIRQSYLRILAAPQGETAAVASIQPK